MIKAKLKKWGSSIGIIVPKELVARERLKAGEEVLLDIRKKITIKEIFGSLGNWKIDPQKIKDELRKEWNK